MLEDILFVHGALRSGTTMFRLMLDAHPRMADLGERDFLFDHLRRDDACAGGWRYDLAALARDAVFRRSRLDLPPGLDGLELMAALVGQLRARCQALPGTGCLPCITLHRNADRLNAVLPGARILHLIRDPRDVARSVVAMGWSGTLYHGVWHWMQTEEAWDRVLPRLAPGQGLDLAYEDLLRDLGPSLQRVCDFAGLPADPAMCDYHRATSYGPPDPTLVQQWRRKARPRDLAELEARVGDLMRRRGYAPSQPQRRLGVLDLARLAVTDALVRWRFRVQRYGLRLFLAEKLSRGFGLQAWSERIRAEMEAIQLRHLK